MIQVIQEDSAYGILKYESILYKGLEHLQISASTEENFLKPSPWTLERDNGQLQS